MKIPILILLTVAIGSLRNVPKFKVDLNDMTTYTPVIHGKGQILKNHIETLKQKLSDAEAYAVWKAFLYSYTPSHFVTKYGKLAKTVLHTSDYLAIPFEELALGISMFEFACFAGVAESPSGELWLLRNFDWNKDAGLSGLFADIEFYEGDRYLFSGIQKIGFGVLMNATVKGEYSMAYNKRFFTDFVFKMKQHSLGAYVITMILTVVVQKAKTFEQAVELVTELSWSADAFIVIAGKRPYQKAIVQLDEIKNQIKTTNTNWLTIGNEDVDEIDEKGESIREDINNLTVFTFDNLSELIQRRPLKTGINIYTSVTKVVTGETYALLADRS